MAKKKAVEEESEGLTEEERRKGAVILRGLRGYLQGCVDVEVAEVVAEIEGELEGD